MFQKKQKTSMLKVFNMVGNKNEAKAMREHISCDWNANSIVQYVIHSKME